MNSGRWCSLAMAAIAGLGAMALPARAESVTSATTAVARAEKPVKVPAGARAELDLEYARAADGRALRLDLYRPAEGGPFPVVVWIHGGGWRGGTKITGAQRAAEWLLPAGIAVASIEYSLSQQLTFPAQIEECKAAVRWLRAHAEEYELDPDHFGTWGSSAGGHLASLVGVAGDVAALEGTLGNPEQSSRVQAVVNWWGITDLEGMDVFRKHAPNTMTAQFLGVEPLKDPAKTRLGSPIHHVTPDDPPFLHFHGRQDASVPVDQGERFHAALEAQGVESRLVLFEGGHAGKGLDMKGQGVDRQVVEFFSRHLKGN